MTAPPRPAGQPLPASAIELRLPVDADEMPLGYDDPDGLAVEMLLAGGGYTTLVLPLDTARQWAGHLYGAVAVAYREATGDPHALSDDELANLPDPTRYQPAQTLGLHGTPTQPARMRFTIAVTIQSQVLSDSQLRAALADRLTGRFNIITVAVSNGQPVAGTPL